MDIGVTRLKIGDTAPDFSAPGTGGREYSLRDFKGQPVVLVFYPGDATPTCTEQLNSYTDNFEEFERLGATVLALSPQDVESHERFHATHKFAFPLLYDEDKRIGMTFGVVGPIGFYRRSVFVIDADGIITYAYRGQAGLAYPRTSEIIKALNTPSLREA